MSHIKEVFLSITHLASKICLPLFYVFVCSESIRGNKLHFARKLTMVVHQVLVQSFLVACDRQRCLPIVLGSSRRREADACIFVEWRFDFEFLLFYGDWPLRLLKLA